MGGPRVQEREQTGPVNGHGDLHGATGARLNANQCMQGDGRLTICGRIVLHLIVIHHLDDEQLLVVLPEAQCKQLIVLEAFVVLAMLSDL
jgi:hypothetical protein